MTFLGWLSDPFKRLSDLQLGDEKVTLNHLECFVNVWAKLSGGQDGNDLYVQLLLGATLYSELQDGRFRFWTRSWEGDIVTPILGALNQLH